MRALKLGPGYTTELAARVGASVYWTREVLKRLETRGLAGSWTFAQADEGGRNLTVRAWRLTTSEERRTGRIDRGAEMRASALLSRTLRERLERVKRADNLLVQEARKYREAGRPPRT
jgi:predicted ArsR family transcriptional regulator